jgi:hypothetical protein
VIWAWGGVGEKGSRGIRSQDENNWDGDGRMHERNVVAAWQIDCACLIDFVCLKYEPIRSKKIKVTKQTAVGLQSFFPEEKKPGARGSVFSIGPPYKVQFCLDFERPKPII